MTWHDTDLGIIYSMMASAENEEVILGGNNRDRDRSWTYLPDCFIVQSCEVLEYIFSVITSGMICVLMLCYAPRQTHILMTCTGNCSMHISMHILQLLHAHSAHATAPGTFSTCNCSMHIQHMQLLHAHSAHATAPCTFMYSLRLAPQCPAFP